MNLAEFLMLIYYFYFTTNINNRLNRNTGNCSYADEVPLSYICSGVVTEDIMIRWHDLRTSVGSTYMLWGSSGGDKSILLVSFGSSLLIHYKTIKIKSITFQITGETNDRNFSVILSESKTHCFKIGLRYLSNLKRNCLKENYNEDDIVDYPIIHYGLKNGRRNLIASSRKIMVILLLTLFVF
ncbi:uncharacterized protein LOC117788132 [Drosophila innubila]|uniref:uncharacterized protein LOC117788132 n=1 Tax=Drosophila innubila TaxID=198719 RepID=UPI00148D01CA|nr:uncharacterized protein LOC117788132 [Drosophila innubila]